MQTLYLRGGTNVLLEAKLRLKRRFGHIITFHIIKYILMVLMDMMMRAPGRIVRSTHQQISNLSPRANLHPPAAQEPVPPTSSTHQIHATPDLCASRRLVLGMATSVALLNVAPSQALADPVASPSSLDLERAAADAYSKRDFPNALESINELISRDPTSARLREMRAVALVDGKRFGDAINEFDACLRLLGPEPTLDRARVLSGRALALEGLADWPGALNDYDRALQIAKQAGADPDPYLLNSVGNCHASLGEWAEARTAYLASAQGFQTARREDRRTGSLQQRLDGAVFAFSNAALMLAQMGDDVGATKEMQTVARRAPGSADMRAALAAQLWAANQEAEAEAEWNFACSNITVGCAKYQDEEWLRKIRRWPPVMIERLQAFLKLRSNAGILEAQENRPQGRKYTGFKE